MPRRKRDQENNHQADFPAALSRFIPDNQVRPLRNGEEYFPAIEAAFDLAKHDIFLETYIYENDDMGQRIAEALKRAVLRGVKVYMLIDGYGSKDLPRSMLDRMRADGVQALIYRSGISPWTFRRERLRRLHRKITVVDRKFAFVGGLNIRHDKERPGAGPPPYDYAVAVEGPLVDVIRLSAQRLWSMVARSHLRKGTVRDGPLPDAPCSGGRMNAAFVVRDNFRHRRDIEKAYMRAIEEAESEIILANAYFLPGFDFRHALVSAAGRGVRVVLLLQGRVEYMLQHYATRALYGSLLAGGVEIYEYGKGFLHAKVAVIDGHWATVGSSNIDPFSLLLSREANVVVDDEEFCMTLTQSLKQTMAADGRRILRSNWKQQPASIRFMSWLSYGFVRFMTGIAGYDRENRPVRRT